MARKIVHEGDRLTLYIALTDRQKLEEIAARQGASLNSVVRTIIRDHLSQLSQVTNGENDAETIS